MTKTELKKALIAELVDSDETLKELVTYSDNNDMDYDLLQAIENVTGLDIDDLYTGESNYWRQASYWSDSIGHMIVLDTGFYIGENVSQFLDQILKVKKIGDDLEIKLSSIEEDK